MYYFVGFYIEALKNPLISNIFWYFSEIDFGEMWLFSFCDLSSALLTLKGIFEAIVRFMCDCNLQAFLPLDFGCED